MNIVAAALAVIAAMLGIGFCVLVWVAHQLQQRIFQLEHEKAVGIFDVPPRLRKGSQ